MTTITQTRALLQRGLVIPAHPLAVDAQLRLDERRQRALSRYYLDAGVGGLAVGVHTTQFEIHGNGMLHPVLELAAEEIGRYEARTGERRVRIAGLVGRTEQAVREAELARSLGYEAGLLSLAAFRDADNQAMLDHCRAVGQVLPLFGFYLQPAVGGRILDYAFWREFFAIEAVVAVKVAAFNRYQTLDVQRALADSGRAGEISLYTGNDDHIVLDLVSDCRFGSEGPSVPFVGGLLGQWAVWTQAAVKLAARAAAVRKSGQAVPTELLVTAQQLTDANAAVFDVAGAFRGCIAGIHEVLSRQGLLAGVWCLDPKERLSPGQAEEITRVSRAYPELTDDAFVREHLDAWLR